MLRPIETVLIGCAMSVCCGWTSLGVVSIPNYSVCVINYKFTHSVFSLIRTFGTQSHKQRAAPTYLPQNRTRVNIRLTNILERAGGVIDPVKISLSSSLIIMLNLVAGFHAVCAHIAAGSKKRRVRWGPVQLGWASIETRPPPRVLLYRIWSP